MDPSQAGPVSPLPDSAGNPVLQGPASPVWSQTLEIFPLVELGEPEESTGRVE